MPAIHMFLWAGGFTLLAVVLAIAKAIHWLGYPPAPQPKPKTKPVEKKTAPPIRYATVIPESESNHGFLLFNFIVVPIGFAAFFLFLWACKVLAELLYPW